MTIPEPTFPLWCRIHPPGNTGVVPVFMKPPGTSADFLRNNPQKASFCKFIYAYSNTAATGAEHLDCFVNPRAPNRGTHYRPGGTARMFLLRCVTNKSTISAFPESLMPPSYSGRKSGCPKAGPGVPRLGFAHPPIIGANPLAQHCTRYTRQRSGASAQSPRGSRVSGSTRTLRPSVNALQ